MTKQKRYSRQPETASKKKAKGHPILRIDKYLCAIKTEL
jgi:hypothetical protein